MRLLFDFFPARESVQTLKLARVQLAWNTIQDGQLACGERSVCVEYSYDVVGTEGDDFMGSIYIYVVTRPVSRVQFLPPQTSDSAWSL